MDKNGTDRLREEFKEEYEFWDWLTTLPVEEQIEYVERHGTRLEAGEEDPTIIHPKEGETIEDLIEKYNLHDATEIIEKMKNL